MLAISKLINASVDDETKRCEIYHALEEIIDDDDSIDEWTLGDILVHMQRCACQKTSDALLSRLDVTLENSEINESLRKKAEIAKYHHLSLFHPYEEAKVYLFHHLDNEPLLEIAYDLSMAEEDYAMAVRCAKMILEGKKSWYNAQDHERKLIDALLGLKAYEEVKPLLRSHVMKDDIKAYHTYVTLHSKDTLTYEINQLMDVFMKDSHHEDVFREIAIDFDEHERLMGYAETYPNVIERVYDVLSDRFKERVAKLFRKLIFERAKEANNRRGYHFVARTIQVAREAIGEDAYEFMFELMELYPRRSALKDELWKLHGVRLHTQNKSF